MKLENSQSFGAGLHPNQIVDLQRPEERMAARLTERLGTSPPVNVEQICRGLAHLAFKRFPIEVDGLCLDLKRSGKRPTIWVSNTISYVRKRFTIAHEIGHIIIPWHRGTIVDDIDAPNLSEKSKYWAMEAEANRFAAELLMPSAWVIGLAERAEHAAGLMHTIHQVADVSQPAAFLKTAKFGKPGYVGAEVRDGFVIRSVRTPETNSRCPKINTQIEHIRMPAAHDPKIIPGLESSYYWWKIRDSVNDPGHQLNDWRNILDAILRDIPPEYRYKARSSINAIIGNAIGKAPIGASIDKIYKLGLEAVHNRENLSYWTKRAIEHEEFKDYILSRSRERANGRV